MDDHDAAASVDESPGRDARIFLSHASADADTARQVCEHLERLGLRCWIAPRDIRPGSDWSEEILFGIDSASALVVLVSPASNASRQVAREVERADGRGVPLLPVRLSDVQPEGGLEYFLSGRQWVDAFRPPFVARLDELAGALAEDGHAQEAARAATAPAPVADVPPDDWDRKRGSGWLRRMLDDR